MRNKKMKKKTKIRKNKKMKKSHKKIYQIKVITVKIKNKKK